MTKFERLLGRYSPAVVVLETFETGPVLRISRIRHLCRQFLHLASNRGIETCVYSRATIRTCFSTIGAVTRYEIVQAVAQHIDVFRVAAILDARRHDLGKSSASLIRGAASCRRMTARSSGPMLKRGHPVGSSI
jgi:hypothetical protein